VVSVKTILAKASSHFSIDFCACFLSQTFFIPEKCMGIPSLRTFDSPTIHLAINVTRALVGDTFFSSYLLPFKMIGGFVEWLPH
jgi:hypothetical protein